MSRSPIVSRPDFWPEDLYPWTKVNVSFKATLKEMATEDLDFGPTQFMKEVSAGLIS